MIALTDKMVQKQVAFNNQGLIVLIIVAVFMFALLGVLSIGYRRQADDAIETESKRLFSSNGRGLLIATVLVGLLAVLTIWAYIHAEQNKYNWHIEEHRVTDKKMEVEAGESRDYTSYYMRVNGYDSRIRVFEDDYQTIEIGDRVYVLVMMGDMPESLWNAEKYIYTGQKFAFFS